MSTDEPSGLPGPSGPSGLSGLADEELLAALRQMLGSEESAPEWSSDLAKGSYGLRAVDAELAALVSDSGLAATRSGLRSDGTPRLAVFDAADLTVEIEVEPGGRPDSWRLVGQLTPAAPARIQVRRQRGEPTWVDADELGRFAVDHLPSGPLSLLCLRPGARAAVTEWLSIG
jgi:hypothetical protein